MSMKSIEEKWDELTQKICCFFNTDQIRTTEDILFIIGLETLGKTGLDFDRQQKMEILHIGVCTVLDAFYRLEKQDEDRWPHFTLIHPLPILNEAEQDNFLKEAIILYFDKKRIG